MKKIQSIINITLCTIFLCAGPVLGSLDKPSHYNIRTPIDSLYDIIDAQDIDAIKQHIASGYYGIDDQIEGVLNAEYIKNYHPNDPVNRLRAYHYEQRPQILKKALDARAKLVEWQLIPQKLNVKFYYCNDYYSRDYAGNFACLEVLLNHKNTHLHESMLARLLNDVVRPQQCEERTPKECAAMIQYKIQALKLLLAYGAHANMRDTDAFNDYSPLYNALKYAYHSVNSGSRKNNFTPSEPIIKMLVQAGANIHERTHNGHTLLHATAQSEAQNAEIIKLFVKLGVPINALANEQERNETALHTACRKENYAMTCELLQAGANASIQDSFGHTPLYWVLSDWKLKTTFDIALLLIDHTNLSLKDTHGLTAWDHFSGDEKGNVGHSVVEKFIARGTDINVRGEHGKTALHRAAAIGSYTTVEALLKHGAHINMEDNYGNTPLHMAIHAYQNLKDRYPRVKEVIQLLRKHGADGMLSNNKGKAAHDALKEIDRQDRIQQYYGKSVNALCEENAPFKQAWDETWWDVNFFTVKTWFQESSQEHVAHMLQNIKVIRSMSHIITECITYGEQTLASKKNQSDFFRDSGNPALDITAAVLLFPLALMTSYSEGRQIKSLQESLRIMKQTKETLDERANSLEDLIKQA